MRLGYKRYAVIIISAIVLIIGGVYLFRFISDKNKLTTQEIIDLLKKIVIFFNDINFSI